MLDINVKLEGEKVIIEGLNKLGDNLIGAIQRGLSRSAKGIYRRAYDFLSGAGAKASDVNAGGYPVPVRTGHLRRMLDWLEPGETKSSEGITFTTGPTEAMIFNSAIYARAIHEGRGSSKKYGPRRFIIDTFEKFNQGSRVEKTIDEEIAKEIKKSL